MHIVVGTFYVNLPISIIYKNSTMIVTLQLGQIGNANNNHTIPTYHHLPINQKLTYKTSSLPMFIICHTFRGEKKKDNNKNFYPRIYKPGIVLDLKDPIYQGKINISKPVTKRTKNNRFMSPGPEPKPFNYQENNKHQYI